MATPPGFRFKPTDEELISFYLKPKITKQHLSYKIMDEVDLYASDSTPWLLFDIKNPDSWDDDNSLYVFTCLSKVSSDPNFVATKSRSNTNKKAGCGTWVQKTSPVPIKDRVGNVIGGRRMLVFQVNEIGDGFDDSKAAYFRMHEYSLWGVNEGLGCDGRDVVLCRISFDVSKRSPVKLITKKTSDCVSKSGNLVDKTKQSKKKKQSKKNVGESSSLKSKSNTSEVVEESKGLDSESIDDGGVGCATVPYNFDLDALDEFHGGLYFDGLGGEGMCFDFDGLGEEMSFDMDEMMQYLNAPQEEELLGGDTTICSLGKRKSMEGDNSFQAKKACL